MSFLSSIVAVELCLRLEPQSATRLRLHQLVREHPMMASPGDKWHLIRQATEVLAGSLHLAEKGCWDFFDDDARARRDFEMWSNGMITKEGARTSPVAGQSPYRGGEPLYMTFTIAMLLRQGSPCERQLARSCDVGQSHLWHRGTFGHILRSLSLVSFASVRADVLYLIPGDEGWGLTAQDLAHPKFHYLRPIAG
jgi:hypothetical protein